MYQRKQRRFRRRSNGRNHMQRGNGDIQGRIRTNLFLQDQTRGNFKTTQSAERLFEKYNTLAKEALSSGDKTLSENYFQHADHFMRIIEGKNKNQNQSKVLVGDKPAIDNKHLSENSSANQEKVVEKKEEKKE